MGNRKQPFGYRMTLGEITILPEEAELVRFIFQGYSMGATLGELTKALCRQEIPYYEGRTWNKNMVSRILEDGRYIGGKGYPALIEPEQPEPCWLIIPASYCLQLFALNPACVVLLLWYSYENIEGVINSRKRANLPSA